MLRQFKRAILTKEYAEIRQEKKKKKERKKESKAEELISTISH